MGIIDFLKLKSEIKTEKNMKDPFFILGCVRSGTTVLRDILKFHNDLECPEETHFFRNGEPFGTPSSIEFHKRTPTLKKHREMDGISEKEFETLYDKSHTRKELATNYVELFLAKKKKPQARWFDKTPQNIYGITLIRNAFPKAKFVHIYRNPLNVVASLKIGKVMPKMSAVAGINYWLESVTIISEFKKLYPELLFEIKYETMLEKPYEVMGDFFAFIDEDAKKLSMPPNYINKETNKFKETLSEEEIKMVHDYCGEFMESYGYL